MQIDAEYTLKVYTDSDEVVVIPEGIQKIGKCAFYRNSTVKEIKLPETLIEIEENAFEQSSIERIVLPENVSVIGSCAFRNCKKLEHVVISKKVCEIQFACFEDCFALKVVSLPETLKKIERRAFANCFMLSDITIPEHLQCLEDESFFGCVALKECVLYPELEHIGENVFANCCNIKLSTNFSEDDDEYWENYGCEAYEYISNYKKAVIFHSAYPFFDEGYFSGAATLAYGDKSVKWNVNSDQILEGLETTVTVCCPFACCIGDCFSVVCHGKIITAELRTIRIVNLYSAEVTVKVISVRKWLDYMKPMSADQNSVLKNKLYDHSDFSIGDHQLHSLLSNENRWIKIWTQDYGGDADRTIYIYTDDAGVDHLVASEYKQSNQHHYYFGDKVLGLHEKVELERWTM